MQEDLYRVRAYGGAKEVRQGVTCPFCAGPNEVKWPMDAGFTTIPKKPSASTSS